MIFSKGWPFSRPPTGSFELNKNSPQAKGLVIWFPLYESGGNQVVEYVLQELNGTFNDSSISRSVTYDHGHVLTMPGGNKISVVCGNVPQWNLTGDAITVTAWVYLTSWVNYAPYISKGHTALPPQYCLRSWTSNNVNFRIYVDSNAENATTTGGELTLNTWHHVAGRLSNTQVDVFVDGVKTTGSTRAGNITSQADQLMIGGDYDQANRVNDGNISDCRVYNIGLSDDTIKRMSSTDPHIMWDLYKPVIPRVVVRAPAAAGNLTISVSESITATDTPTALITELHISTSDSITATDTATVLLPVLPISETEAITAADVVTMLVTDFISESEAISVAEAIQLALVSHITATESITAADTATVRTDENISVADTITLAEAVTVSLTEAGAISITTTETITASDTATALITELHISVSDSITATDTDTVLITELHITATESVSVSDTATALITELHITATESITASDAPTVSVAIVGTIDLSVSESITASDTATALLPQLYTSVSDAIAVADSAEVDLPGAAREISVSDSITVADVITLTIILTVAGDNATFATFRDKRSFAVFRDKRTTV